MRSKIENLYTRIQRDVYQKMVYLRDEDRSVNVNTPHDVDPEVARYVRVFGILPIHTALAGISELFIRVAK